MRTITRTMMRHMLLASIVVTLNIGCTTTSHWATVSGYKIQSQNQESGQGELELRLESIVKMAGSPLTLVLKNASGKSIEIVKTKIVLTMNDTIMYADPLLSGSVYDQIVLSAYSSQLTESNTVAGTPRYRLYDPVYSTAIYGQSNTFSSQTTETAGYIQKVGDAITLYPETVTKIPLRDAFLWYASNTRVMSPEDEGDPPTVPFYANSSQRYGNADVVRLGIPILIDAMRQVSARTWRIYVAYRVGDVDEIKVAKVVYTPSEPTFIQQRYNNQD